MKLEIIALESSTEAGKFPIELQRIIDVAKLSLKLENVVGKNEKLESFKFETSE